MIEPLIALGTLQLVAEGKVALDDPIGKYVAEAVWEGETVTVHHLLSQTSGLIGWFDVLAPGSRADATLADLLELVHEQGLQSSPGKCFEYSETNALLLGVLLQEVGGKPLDAWLTEKILAPADVEAMGFDVEDAPPPRQGSLGMREISGEMVAAPEGVHVFGEDELCASALDLFRIRRAITARVLLDDARTEAMTTTKRLLDGTETGYGYGVNISSLDAFQGVSIGGSAEGTTVHLAYYPAPELTIVVLAAAEGAPLIPLERRLARLVLDLPLPGVQDLDLEEERAAMYTGTYQLGCTTLIVKRREDGRLELSGVDRPTYLMLYQGRHAFTSRRDPEIRFEFVVPDGDKRSSALVIEEHGLRSEAVRFD